MSSYSKAWLAWGAATLVSFAVIETKALVSGTSNATLSANLRHAFGFTDEDFHAPVRRLAFYAGVGWLTYHIADPAARAIEEMRALHPQM